MQLLDRSRRFVGDAAGWCVCAILCASIITVPVALGGTHVFAMAALHVATAISVCLWAVFLRPDCHSMAFPLLCFLAALFQLAPLPDSLMSMIAPVSAGAWKIVHAQQNDAWGCVSIEPGETASSARRMLLAIGTVAAVSGLAARRVWRNALLVALATTGAMIWSLGLLFPGRVNSFLILGLVDSRGPFINGRTPLEPPVATASFGFPELVRVAGQQYLADAWTLGDVFGSYVITNHFAGALTLTIPFLAAAWLITARRWIPAWLSQCLAASLFAGGFATIALLVKSRAGAASFLMATLTFLLAAAPAGAWRRGVAVLTIGYAGMLAVFVLALYGPIHDVETWFPTEIQPALSALLKGEGRVIATHVAQRMFLSSPAMGTGLGTYGALYPRMVGDGAPWYFAHNDYAQLLAESGLVGLGLSMVPSVALVRAAKYFWSHSAGVDRMLGAAAWAAVAGIGIHSFFDWNLHVPANALLTCVAAGLALASGAAERGGYATASGSRRGNCFVAAVLILAVVVSTGYLIRDAISERAQRNLREAIVAARLHTLHPRTTSPQEKLVKAIANGERMARWDPGDAQLAVALGQAHLHLTAFPMAMADMDACLASAEKWFRVARQNCAICRGIAEPLDDEAATQPR
jgi:O-antigen ligase